LDTPKNDLPGAFASEEPEEGGGRIDGCCERVPEGKYEVRYMYYETAIYFGAPRVIVHCAIDASDQYAGVIVSRFYNVKEISQPPGKYGNYVAFPRGDLVRESRRFAKDTKRMDRISFSHLKGKRLLARLETVTQNHSRNGLDPTDYYSKIAEFIRIIPDEEWI